MELVISTCLRILFIIFGFILGDIDCSSSCGYYCSYGCCGSSPDYYCCEQTESASGIAGIVVGSLFALAIFIGVIVCIVCMCKQGHNSSRQDNTRVQTVHVISPGYQQGPDGQGYQQGPGGPNPPPYMSGPPPSYGNHGNPTYPPVMTHSMMGPPPAQAMYPPAAPMPTTRANLAGRDNQPKFSDLATPD